MVLKGATGLLISILAQLLLFRVTVTSGFWMPYKSTPYMNITDASEFSDSYVLTNLFWKKLATKPSLHFVVGEKKVQRPSFPQSFSIDDLGPLSISEQGRLGAAEVGPPVSLPQSSVSVNRPSFPQSFFIDNLGDLGISEHGRLKGLDPICLQPPIRPLPGVTCIAHKERFTYKDDINQCVRYIYGGCQGTENLFHTKEECEKRCSIKETASENSPQVESPSFPESFDIANLVESPSFPETFFIDSLGGHTTSEDGHLKVDEAGPAASHPDSSVSDQPAVSSDEGGHTTTEDGHLKHDEGGHTTSEDGHLKVDEGGHTTSEDGHLKDDEGGHSTSEDEHSKDDEDKPADSSDEGIPDSAEELPGFKDLGFFGSIGGDDSVGVLWDEREIGKQRGDRYSEPTYRAVKTMSQALHGVMYPKLCLFQRSIAAPSCKNFTTEFYFDSNLQTCSSFEGCGDSPNTFKTYDKCQVFCRPITKLTRRGLTTSFKELQKKIDNMDYKEIVCKLQYENGSWPCDHQPKDVYYFNVQKEECILGETKYSGCKSNPNNFENFSFCRHFCRKFLPILPPTVSPPECNLPPTRGTCDGTEERFYYNKDKKICEQFIYSGCAGNENNFPSFESCQKHCREIPSYCTLPLEEGVCDEKIDRYYFNMKTKDCELFTYTGCSGNENNFEKKTDCLDQCAGIPPRPPVAPEPIDPEYVDTPFREESCSEPPTKGDCELNFTRYYFDVRSKTCQEFTYGACEGNNNRFTTLEMCKEKCEERPPIIPGLPGIGRESDAKECKPKPDRGICNDHILRYYYDRKSQQCKYFYYSGCEGNSNNFLTEQECIKTCNAFEIPPPKPEDVCQQRVATGNCSEADARFYYNANAKACQGFTFTGCNGNENRFERLLHCKATCERGQPPAVPPSYCNLYPEGGPCFNYVSRYYFDFRAGACKRFWFGGCLGNRNRFQTIQDCESTCIRGVIPNPSNDQLKCFEPAEVGPCQHYQSRFRYNPRYDKCVIFAYGGCEGNGNNFMTLGECEDACGGVVQHLAYPRYDLTVSDIPKEDLTLEDVWNEISKLYHPTATDPGRNSISHNKHSPLRNSSSLEYKISHKRMTHDDPASYEEDSGEVTDAADDTEHALPLDWHKQYLPTSPSPIVTTFATFRDPLEYERARKRYRDSLFSGKGLLRILLGKKGKNTTSDKGLLKLGLL